MGRPGPVEPGNPETRKPINPDNPGNPESFPGSTYLIRGKAFIYLGTLEVLMLGIICIR